MFARRTHLARFAITSFVLFIVLAISCCSRQSGSSRNPVRDEQARKNSGDAVANDGRSVPVPSPRQLVTFAERIQQKTGAEQTQKSSFRMESVANAGFEPPSPISNPYNNSLLPIKPYDEITPDDFTIGPLHAFRHAVADEREIVRTFGVFAEALKKGEIARTTIDDGEYAKIAHSLPSSASDTPIESYRIGKITLTDRTEGYVTVKFTNKTGETHGEIYMTKRDETWYITDVQVDFTNYTPRNQDERYTPSTYGWMY